MATHLDLTKGFSIGDNLAVKIGDSLKFFQITNRDTIMYIDDASSAISANGSESYTERTNLDPPDDQLYQIYRIECLHNVEAQLNQPASTNRWGLEKSPQGGILTDKNDHTPLNIFILEDYPPNLQVVNGTTVSVTPKFRWHGWRYLLKPLDARPNTFTIVPATGMSR